MYYPATMLSHPPSMQFKATQPPTPPARPQCQQINPSCSAHIIPSHPSHPSHPGIVRARMINPHILSLATKIDACKCPAPSQMLTHYSLYTNNTYRNLDNSTSLISTLSTLFTAPGSKIAPICLHCSTSQSHLQHHSSRLTSFQSLIHLDHIRRGITDTSYLTCSGGVVAKCFLH